MREHTSGGQKCARYTLSHFAYKIEAAFACESRSTASRLEYLIKRLTKSQKEELNLTEELEKSLGEGIDLEDHSIVSLSLANKKTGLLCIKQSLFFFCQ